MTKCFDLKNLKTQFTQEKKKCIALFVKSHHLTLNYMKALEKWWDLILNHRKSIIFMNNASYEQQD